MTYNELNQAVGELSELFDHVKPLTRQVSQLMAGRLREMRLDSHVLTAMKRELANWDMGRKRWK